MARFSSDRNGFREFLREAESLVDAITGPNIGDAELKRAVHTLKGNCAIFGAQALASQCHELENRLAEMADEISDLDRRSLGVVWGALKERMQVFLGEEGNAVTVDRGELDELRHKARTGASAPELAAMLESWIWEPAARRLARIGDQMRSLGTRMGKGTIDVDVDGGGLRFEAARWSPFFSSFAHVVRNAVDHGIEAPAERAAAGKPERPRVVVRTVLDGDQVTIELGDDGRGIDWTKVAQKAAACGLDGSSHEALVKAIFRDNFSTRDEVTELSGRGVGLAAVSAACDALGGTIRVDSALGRGTLFRFSFPAIGVAVSQLSSARPTLATAA